MAMTPAGWVPDELLSATSLSQPEPPQYIKDVLAEVGTPWDPSKFAWDPTRMDLIMRSNGARYNYGSIPDPSLGTDVVTNLSNYNAAGPNAEGTFHFDEGVNPFIAFPGETYNAGLVPGSGIFLSADPAEIAEYRSSARDRNLQGIARVASIVGGGAALGATGSGPVFGGSAAAPAAGEAATTFPYVSGGPVTVSSIPGVTAGVPAAGAAAAGPILDSSGAVIPGTESVASGGGGMLQNLFSGGVKKYLPQLIGGLLGAIDANNQPDSMTTNQGGTSTSVYGQVLPDTITGPAADALAQLQTLFGGFGGTPDPVTTAAIERLQGFGGPAINPYLDTVFNAAADATQSRLSSEFARAGRNVGGADHQGFRSDELQQLAAGIYGPGYEAERNREFSSAPLLLSAGEYLRNLPFSDFSRYLASLQGLLPFFPGTQTQATTQSGSVTQPLFNNPLAGFLGGAQLGSLFA